MKELIFPILYASLLGVLYILIPGYCCAQNDNNFRFKKYTTSDGLAHNVGFEIMQDNDGFIWVGTDDGLSRFDGFEFKNFDKENGLKTPSVVAIDEAPDGTLHLGTYGEGHNFLVADTIWQSYNNVHPRINQIDVLSDGRIILDFGKVGSSQLYIKTPKNLRPYRVYFFQHGNSIGYFMHEDSSIENFNSLHIEQKEWGNLIVDHKREYGVQIYSYCVTREDEIWLSTNRGVYQFPVDPLIKSFDIYVPTAENKILKPKGYLLTREKRLPKQAFYSTSEGPLGNLWFGGKKILASLPKEKEEAIIFTDNLPENNISRFVVSRSGRIFLATSNNIIAAQKADLYSYDIASSSITRLNSLISLKSAISYMHIDREENLWVSTHGNGLYCIFPQNIKSYTLEDGLSNSFVQKISETPDGNIWVGTQSGLNFFDGNNWKTYQWLASNDFSNSGMGISKKGELLTTAFERSQCSLFKIRSKNLPPLSNISLELNFILDEKGNAWSSKKLWEQFQKVTKGLKVIDPLPISNEALLSFFQQFPDIDKHYYSLVFAFSKDTVWIGSKLGKGIYKIWGDNLIHFTKEMGLPHDQINDFAIDSNRNLWVAGEEGLYQIAKDLIVDKGFLSKRCRTLYFDHRGTLWIGTTKGLHYFEDNTIRAINSSRGLIDDAINCIFEDSKNQLWIGTSQGISMMDNQLPKKKENPPEVYLERMELNGNKVSPSALFNIPPKTQLAIFYTSIAFQNPDDITFQYRLEREEEWTTTKNRSVFFQNLEEGEYRFEVRAKKLNSDWGGIKNIQFRVHPPWWSSRKFITIWALLFGILVACIPLLWIRKRQHKKMKEVQVQNELSRLELKALQAQMNPHFVFNALNAIMYFIMKEDKFQANLYLSKFARLMRMFLDSSKSNYNTLADEMELIKLYVELEMLRFNNKFDFKLKIDSAIPLESTETPSMILQPFIENAINHGLAYKDEKGLLSLRLRKERSCISFTIEDNGIGREASAHIRNNSLKKHKSHATKIIEDRINLLNAAVPDSIQIETTDLADELGLARGTRVEIKVILSP